MTFSVASFIIIKCCPFYELHAAARLIPDLSTSVSSTPVSSTPVSSTPVLSTPVSSTPVSSTPVSSTPVSSTTLSCVSHEILVLLSMFRRSNLALATFKQVLDGLVFSF